MTEFIWCQECGNKNDISAKFCSNCGSKIVLHLTEENICNNCGHENEQDDSYCQSCGSKLSRRSRNQKRSQEYAQPEKKRLVSQKSKKKVWNPLMIGALIVVFIIIYLFIDSSRETPSNSPASFQPSIEQKTDNIELENKVYEVASKFVCACISCAEEPLESCSCDTAQQERQFIRTALQQGQSVDEVVNAVNMNYGWIRDEYKSQYGNGKLSLDVNSMLNDLVAGGQESTDQGTEPIATFADRMEIISQFACPCGKCEDELKICDCDHPKGAQEVKQFIDEKIKSGKYTIDKIIEFVNHKYNNRIG